MRLSGWNEMGYGPSVGTMILRADVGYENSLEM